MNYDTPADFAKAMRDQFGLRTPSTTELAQGFTSTAKLDVIELWPELFVGVSDVAARAIQNACVASWHEGWVPNREDVENLTEFTRGAIDGDEYGRRVRGAAERRHHAVAAV